MASTIRDNPNIGTVRSQERRIVQIDVAIDPYEFDGLKADDNETEFVVALNGRILKRMSAWQLRRTLGIAER